VQHGGSWVGGIRMPPNRRDDQEVAVTPDGYDIKRYRDEVHCTPVRG
jgi:hypothetical protein